jgi:hypothetical protein
MPLLSLVERLSGSNGARDLPGAGFNAEALEWLDDLAQYCGDAFEDVCHSVVSVSPPWEPDWLAGAAGGQKITP